MSHSNRRRPVFTFAATSHGSVGDNVTPYSASSFWNTAIASLPYSASHPNAATMVGELRSASTQPPVLNSPLTGPKIYAAAGSTTNITVATMYTVGANGTTVVVATNATVAVPIPPGTPAGAQVIVWNTVTGDEWGFNTLSGAPYTAVSGYYYNSLWSAQPPPGDLFPPSGLPMLAGMIRGWEIQAGAISHALAITVPNAASGFFRFPATAAPASSYAALPIGARLALRPPGFGGNPPTSPLNTITAALQSYGAIVVGQSAMPTLVCENSATGTLTGFVDTTTTNGIDLTQLDVLDWRTVVETQVGLA